ncbi:MAG: M48 family metallopeptidase [Burkholderiales bacterium]|nr:M48 family metallopeptidase [Burkholderiales bacterium]
MDREPPTSAPAPTAPACACRGARRRRLLFTGLLAGAAAPLLGAPGSALAADPECRRSPLTGAVSAETVEGAARQQYLQLMREAQSKNALAAADDPQLQRLRYVAARLVPFAPACNERARAWRWEVQLLRSNSLNAFCMPGGKIAFFSGILSRLKLSDDEVAMIMGHEAAHALLEHARERVVKSTGTNVGLRLLAAMFGLGNLGDLAAQGLSQLANLRFSRDDESEADALGLLLAARAGYDPRASISLWQKMGAANEGRSPPAWLSTHPAGPARVKEIQARLPRVLPEFQRAAAPDRRFPAAA